MIFKCYDNMIYNNKSYKVFLFKIQMKARTFNSGIMPRLNEEWTAEVLGMELNPFKGPDILDDKKFLEVKFSLIKPKKNRESNYPLSWTVLNHQVEYANIWAIPGFWGLGIYELDRAVKEIRTYNSEELEKMVVQRELYIVHWSWIDQFEPSICRGKTKYSQWENSFRYPKFKMLPHISKTYDVKKGKVHLTKGVPDYLFDI